MNLTYIWIFLVAYSFFFMFIGLFNFRKPILPFTNKGSMLAIIPAHNEASNIASTITSLQESGISDIVIVADACTDATIQIAKVLGCYIFETAKRNKGKALNEFMQNSPLYQNYCYYTVVDCGSTVSKAYVQVLKNNLLLYPIVQFYPKPVTKGNNWNFVSVFYKITYALQELKMKALDLLNMNSFLCGSGFAWVDGIQEQIKWNPNCIIEDVELSLILHRKKIKIKMLFGDYIYDEKPSNLRVAYKQLLRWARGNWYLFFHGYFYTYRIDDFMMVISVFITFLFFPIIILGIIQLPYFYFIFLGLYILWAIGNYLLNGELKKFPLQSFLFFPIFNLILIFITFTALFSWNNRNWVRTDHSELRNGLGSGGAKKSVSDSSLNLLYTIGANSTNEDVESLGFEYLSKDGF